MAVVLTIPTFKLNVNWTLADSALIAPTTSSGNLSVSTSYTNGTGAGAANKLYATTLAPAGGGGTASLDLSGSLLDALGNAVVFTSVKGIYIEHQTSAASSTTTINGVFLTQGTNSILSGTTPAIVLRPGYNLAIFGQTAGGYTVTNTTQDLITFTNNAAAVVAIRVVIIGEG